MVYSKYQFTQLIDGRDACPMERISKVLELANWLIGGLTNW